MDISTTNTNTVYQHKSFFHLRCFINCVGANGGYTVDAAVLSLFTAENKQQYMNFLALVLRFTILIKVSWMNSNTF